MTEQRPIDDTIDELIVVQHELHDKAEEPEAARPLAGRSVELAEDINGYEVAEREALERRP